MRTSFKRPGLFFVCGVMVVALSVSILNFTNVCRLEAVTLDGKLVSNWPDRFDALREKSLFRQPLDSLAQVVLAEKGTFRVDISCSWPHTLNIRTNGFSPSCFLLDKTSGRLCGLEQNGRTVPLRNAVLDWERPVLTGVESGRWFSYCRDVRVKVVVDQLEKLRKSNLNLFRLIDEIDFETTDYVQVSVSGLPYRLKVRPEHLTEDLSRFVDFVAKFDPELDGVRHLDLRFDNMIICARGKD